MFSATCLLIFFSISILDASTDLLRGIIVPQYAFVDGSATLSCEYDLRQTQLYSLKWYHNKTEFYRYVPTERTGPINIRPTHKFVLHEVSRSERRVVLNLSRLTPFASGEYRCELIAEHPSFRTETLSSVMTVLRDHLTPPVIVGVKEIYEPDDVIEIMCQPYMPPEESPVPSIKWYLNGQMIAPRRFANYGRERAEDETGAILRMSADEISDAGGTGVVECRLVLGNHQEKASKVLRVRKRQISYVNTLFSSSGSSPTFDSFSMAIIIVTYFLS
ncbi:UNVERIFIED_CONTAM: hypothetical protein RMT77_009064 [Armadillidium vulgare]